MDIESQPRYIIYGVGAIGAAVGGLLLKAGARVAFIARPLYAEAIKQGITILQDGRETFFQAQAVTAVNQLEYGAQDVVIFAMKSQVMQAAVAELAAVAGTTLPVVCLQNGVRNEAFAAERFAQVYAALVFLSAVQLDPQRITMPRGRSIVIGRYPNQVDELSERMCADLRRAGFEALASPYTMAMKWGKLIANLNNATHTITGYWLERGIADPSMRRLIVAVREEGLRVLAAAGIAVAPPAGEPSPIQIVDLTNKLREQKASPEALPKALAMPEELRTHASMYQDLLLGRASHEADYLNGDIVALGRQLGIATPYNSTLLEIVNRMFARGEKPGIYTPEELHTLIVNRANAYETGKKG
ncbi:MAG: ketopantoate reductase family protein [Acidobacteria bacterium]|nr:ketopantoate reductase family protein [Acidobacteriota bacterium]